VRNDAKSLCQGPVHGNAEKFSAPDEVHKRATAIICLATCSPELEGGVRGIPFQKTETRRLRRFRKPDIDSENCSGV
jgi:hypothetical protein